MEFFIWIQLHHLSSWGSQSLISGYPAGAVIGSPEILLSMGWPWPSACVAPRQQKDGSFLFVKSQQQVRSCVIVYQSLGVKYYGLGFFWGRGVVVLVVVWFLRGRIGLVKTTYSTFILKSSSGVFRIVLILCWLVVWNMAFMTFHIFGIIIPTDFHIFQRVGQPPTSLWTTKSHGESWFPPLMGLSDEASLHFWAHG